MFLRWAKPPPKKSLLLLGPRRAGKTTWLKMQFPDYAYQTLDDYDTFLSAKTDPKGLLAKLSKHCILDEVQRLPELLISVKYFMDEKNYRFLMTGSSSLGLLSAGSETLAGRIALQHFPTACWGEELGPPTHKLFAMPKDPFQIREANRCLAAAMRFGGFPEVLTIPHAKQKRETLKDYRDTYFLRDVLLLSHIENASALLILMKHLTIMTGSSIDYSQLSQQSGISFPTVKKYLHVLEASGLTTTLYSYAHGPAKKFVKAAKRYFADNGIITSLNVPLSAGQWLENFVVSEIEKRRKLGAFSCEFLQYYKSSSGAEIDLILETPRITYGIEIKHTSSPAPKHLRNLRDFVSDAPKRKGILLYLGEKSYQQDNITILPVAHMWRAL